MHLREGLLRGVAVPGAAPLVLLHEPILAAVLVGAVPTGYSAIRPATGPVVADRLRVWPTPFGVRVRPASSCTLGDGWAALLAFPRAGVDGVGLAVGTLDLICFTLDSAPRAGRRVAWTGRAPASLRFHLA